MDPRERFTEIATGPESEIDLAEAALWLAAEACPGLDVASYLEKLSAIAASLRPVFELAESPEDQVRIVNRELFQVLGFRGSRDDYYDPRNSFLNDVIDRRVGIPITLCTIFVDVARRLGLDAAGINFPGHFLARVGEGPIVVDAFEGRIASHEECGERLRQAMGPSTRLSPQHLAPARPKQVLQRMLGNLKAIYAGRRNFQAAIACCDRSLLLFPDAPAELRDRGLMYHALEVPRAAVLDLERYLTLAPRAEGVDEIRKLVTQLRADLPPLH